MLPFSTLMIPLFQIVKELKLRNNYLGLILPYTAANLPFCVLMMRNYFDSLPREIEEAAHVDGASNFQLYWRIAMPLSVPALTATGIFIAIGSWNEFILSLLFMTKPEMRTAPLATVYYLRYQGPDPGTRLRCAHLGCDTCTALLFCCPEAVRERSHRRRH